MIITGIVSDTDCQPIANAIIDVWHTDAQGRYDDQWFRGRILTGDQGGYQFETIRPASYRQGFSNRPAHIHFKVAHQNYTTLTTQLYFIGDPALAPDDPCGSCRSDDPTHIIDLEKEASVGKALWKGIFNIVIKS